MENRHGFDLKKETESLVAKIRGIQIAEAMKEPDVMDADLVTECVDFILDAENRTLDLSADEIKNRVKKIPFKDDKKLSFKTRKIIKALIIAAIIFILFAITCAAVKPVRNFFTNVTDDGTFFSFRLTDTDDYLHADYTYIPEGYSLVSVNNMRYAQAIDYDNHGKTINITTIKNKGGGRYINTEKAVETKEITFGQYTGFYCKNNEHTFLLWVTGKYNHLIDAENCDAITEDELVKIALSREKQ